MPRLPPLNAVRAFEAAARHESFKRAADELNVTHGAVSRQIASLEGWLGISLFRRLNRQVALTPAGRKLFAEISPALARIALATSSLTDRTRTTTLVVNAPPTFTMRWLIPRLSRFLQNTKSIEIRLETSLKPVDFVAGRYDLAIRRSPETPPGVHSRMFLREMLIPVCSREWLDHNRLQKVEDLRLQTLIHTATVPMDWPEWLARVGMRGLRAEQSLNFEEMFFTLQAATNGLGVAIAPAALVTDEVAAGRLVFPLAEHCSRNHDYRVLFAAAPEKKAAVEKFCAWLSEEGARSIAEAEKLLPAKAKPSAARRKTAKR